MTKRVFITGGDGLAWALDEDMRHFKTVLQDRVRFCELKRADVLESVWWEALLNYSREELEKRVVICHLDNPPYVYMRHYEFHKVLPVVDLWVARSDEALRQCRHLALPACYLPYTVDRDIFTDNPDGEKVAAVQRQWKIPEDRYLIGNFYRDTDVKDLVSPKYQKGPDAVVEIARLLIDRELPVHFVLAGPRRYYIMNKFRELGVPFTYIGKEDSSLDDDLKVNAMERKDLAVLYKLIDVYLGMSRWEGGPQSVLETAATRCAMASNRVGLAWDVLSPESLFNTPAEAADLIENDIYERSLKGQTEKQFEKVVEGHGLDSLGQCVHSLIDQGAFYPETKRTTPYQYRERQPKRFVWKFSKKARRRAKLSWSKPPRPAMRVAILSDNPDDWSCQWLKQCLGGHDRVVLEDAPGEDTMICLLHGQVDFQTVVKFSESRPGMKLVQRFTQRLQPDGMNDSAVAEFIDFQRTHVDVTVFNTNQLMGGWIQAGLQPRRPRVMGESVDEILPLEQIREGRSKILGVGAQVPSLKSIHTPSLKDLPLKSEAYEILDESQALVVGDDSWLATEWAALAQMRRVPVFYPEKLSYGEWVEFGGASYQGGEDLSSLLDQAIRYPGAFARLVRTESRHSWAEKFLAMMDRL